ncbi:MAG: hypothetical protein OEN23_02180 [Paracoccaceae bacterium]|nr:hypothetical protein [Paracoccaceae bacterium]
MKRMIFAAAILSLTATPTLAQGKYSADSQAKSWNLLGEEKARFEGVAIDALCVLTGDCPADCGAGLRQMGILRNDDGAFLLANKNTQPAFTGATVDLAPYCGQAVEIDGLLVGDKDVTPGLGDGRLLQIQTVRLLGEEKPKKANLWTKDWAKRNPDVGGKGPWFRRDPKVTAEIEANGRLGLGAEADQKFIEENF